MFKSPYQQIGIFFLMGNSIDTGVQKKNFKKI